ncbi:MAG: hypothetical protein KJ077_10485 [Anaerolineae bacterium]|nr:hypothetical protein [Anaerolineae bacterium]
MNPNLDPTLVFLIGLVTVFYGTGTSFIQERFGKFHDLSPSVKQLVNAVINLVLPYVLVFLQPYWRPEFGEVNAAVTSLFFLVAPVAIWVVSQVAHRFDPHRLKG